MTTDKRPLTLLILDGWGHRENPQKNAVYHAKTPVLDRLRQQYPHALISTSGTQVGLPDGQMGNSEVGHINIGSGRVVYQEVSRINRSIDDGSFFKNPALVEAIDNAVTANGAVHVMGLLSPGGVHSHQHQIESVCKMAVERGATRLYLHAFLDGRDTPPRSAMSSLTHFNQLFSQLGCGRIASIIGRYYAMDRDHRWERTHKAYELITQGKSSHQYSDAVDALTAAYDRDESDEFVTSSAITGADGQTISVNDDDTVIFMNFRTDRARQLSHSFVDTDFDGFARSHRARVNFVTLTEYAADIDALVAYPSTPLINTFGEVLQNNNKTQLRISETEKYAHVTFFFNGGKETPFKGEDRTLVPSPHVATYDLQPQMSSAELTDKLVKAILSKRYDAIICNYPNGDMVGHTGNFAAAVIACETVDACIGRIIEAIEQVKGECLITADHGNVEKMADEQTGQAHTAHTNQPVPLIYVGRRGEIAKDGRLSDLAPTMLTLMGQSVPPEMTGRSIITLDE